MRLLTRADLGLNDPSLFIQDAFVNGEWVKLDSHERFDVYSAYTLLPVATH